MEVDWAALRGAATEVMRHAYAPYSRFPVGAAGLADDGRLVTGCNVENASYGVVLCAECGVVSALHSGGGGQLRALSCVDETGSPLMPCGRCRQLLWEHGGPDCLVDAEPAPLRMADLLPYAFDAGSLSAVEVPAKLATWRGRGAVFVHPDLVGGEQVWTGYWERSTGDDTGQTGILEEAPTWQTAAEAVRWGLARTPRVVVVDADGLSWWAGEGEPPGSVDGRWDSRWAGQ